MSLIGQTRSLGNANLIYNSRNYMSLIGVYLIKLMMRIYNSRNYMSLIGYTAYSSSVSSHLQ